MRRVTGVFLGLCFVACHGSTAETADDGAGAGSDGLAPPTLGTAAGHGIVSGIVVDAATGTPIAGAVASAGGATATTLDALGTFALEVATGRAAVTVTAAGYLRWTSEIPVGSRAATVRVALVRAADATAIAPTGGSIDGGSGGTLTFPSDAFAGSTPVAATFLDRATTAAGFGLPQFDTDDGMVHRVVAGVSVGLATEPTKPAILTFPIPVATTHFTGYTLWQLSTTGTWTAPLAPTLMTATTISFEVSHFSDYGVSGDVAADDPTVADIVRWDTGTATDTVGTVTAALHPGDEIPGGAVIDVAAGGSLTTADPRGSTIEIGGGTEATLAICVDATVCVPGTDDFLMRYGRLDAEIQPKIGAVLRKFHLRTVDAFGHPAISLGDKGTVLEARLDKCPGSDRTITEVDVFEGEADVTIEATGQVVPLGANGELAKCSDCAADEPVACSSCLGGSSNWIVTGTTYKCSGHARYMDPNHPGDYEVLDVPGTPGYCAMTSLAVSPDGSMAFGSMFYAEQHSTFDPATCRGTYDLIDVPETAADGSFGTFSASVEFTPDAAAPGGTILMSTEYLEHDVQGDGQDYWYQCSCSDIAGTYTNRTQ